MIVLSCGSVTMNRVIVIFSDSLSMDDVIILNCNPVSMCDVRAIGCDALSFGNLIIISPRMDDVIIVLMLLYLHLSTSDHPMLTLYEIRSPGHRGQITHFHFKLRNTI